MLNASIKAFRKVSSTKSAAAAFSVEKCQSLNGRRFTGPVYFGLNLHLLEVFCKQDKVTNAESAFFFFDNSFMVLCTQFIFTRSILQILQPFNPSLNTQLT